MDIRTGTRVIHRRYAWVGTVVSAMDDAYIRVRWEKHDMTHPSGTVENLSDLRATPRQPNDFADHIHDTVATAYGHSSTPRRCV